MDVYDAVRNAAARAEPLGHTRYKHSSAIISAKGKTLAIGRNHYRGEVIAADDGHPIHKTVHSEIHALTKVNVRRLSGAIMVNYACTTNAGNAVISRPCDICWAVLRKLGFKKIVYSLHAPVNGPYRWKEELF